MNKHEAIFTTKFATWAREHIQPPAVFEIKHTRGKRSFPLRELYDHQRDSLIAAHSGAFTYKIPDDSRGFKPFDLCYFGDMRSYLVIKYPDKFYVIPAWRIPTNKSTLTEEDACEIACAEG